MQDAIQNLNADFRFSSHILTKKTTTKFYLKIEDKL